MAQIRVDERGLCLIPNRGEHDDWGREGKHEETADDLAAKREANPVEFYQREQNPPHYIAPDNLATYVNSRARGIPVRGELENGYNTPETVQGRPADSVPNDDYGDHYYHSHRQLWISISERPDYGPKPGNWWENWECVTPPIVPVHEKEKTGSPWFDEIGQHVGFRHWEWRFNMQDDRNWFNGGREDACQESAKVRLIAHQNGQLGRISWPYKVAIERTETFKHRHDRTIFASCLAREEHQQLLNLVGQSESVHHGLDEAIRDHCGKREKMIIGQLAGGCTFREIAYDMRISERQVEYAAHNVRKKLRKLGFNASGRCEDFRDGGLVRITREECRQESNRAHNHGE